MTYLCLERSERNGEKHDKKKPLIPLMNEGLGELKCRRHFVLPFVGKYVVCPYIVCIENKKGVDT